MMDSSQEVKTRDERSFGDILAEARKSRNYSLSDIRENIKVAEHILSALEANDIDALPDQTYVRGYIKAYAKFLGIPEQDVLDKFNRLVPEGNPSELKPRSEISQQGVSSQSPVIKLVTIVLIAIGLIAVIYGSIQYYQEKASLIEDDLESQRPSFTGNSLDSPGSMSDDSTRQGVSVQQNARLTDNGELMVEDDARVDLLAEEDAGYKSIAETVSQDESSQQAAGEDENEQSLLEEEVFPEDSPTPAVKAGDDTIMFYAENGSWLQVHDANDVRLFYNMLPEGGRKTLRGLAPFSVFMGNADTTEVEINDLRVDLSSYVRSNNTARFKISSEKQTIVFH
jgi:cytoskeleton protein RodZ